MKALSGTRMSRHPLVALELQEVGHQTGRRAHRLEIRIESAVHDLQARSLVTGRRNEARRDFVHFSTWGSICRLLTALCVHSPRLVSAS